VRVDEGGGVAKQEVGGEQGEGGPRVVRVWEGGGGSVGTQVGLVAKSSADARGPRVCRGPVFSIGTGLDPSRSSTGGGD